MNFIYYSRMADGVGRRIQEIVKHQFSGAEIEVFRDMESLTQRLCGPVGEETAALLETPSSGPGPKAADYFMFGLYRPNSTTGASPSTTVTSTSPGVVKLPFSGTGIQAEMR